MPVPQQLPTGAMNEKFAGVVYHIEGELVPVLHIELGTMPVFFEHHILLWKDPSVDIEIKPLKGAFKRMIAGIPIFLTRTVGYGRIAFSRDGVGHVFGMHLKAGQSIDVREHQFLAATDNVDYSYTRVKGVSNIMFGGTGLFIDTFASGAQDGILWLHGYGNVFEVNLKAGEKIDIECGGWIYKDRSVQMETIRQSIRTGLLAAAGTLFWNRFTGPGRVGIQSMYIHMPTSE